MTFPLTIFFMFLVFWRPQEWLVPWMYGWPVLDVVTYGAVISLVLESGQQKTQFPKTPAVMLAGGLWFAAIMSHVVHGYFQGMIDATRDTFKLCIFLVLLLVVINTISRIRWVLLTFLVGAIVMAVHAIMQQTTGVGFAGHEPLTFYYSFKDRWVSQSRFFGIFNDPNDLGQFFALCAPLAFAWPRRLSVVTISLASGIVWLLAEAMLATASRGTLIAVIAIVGCQIMMWFPVKWLPYLGAIMLAGGLLVCALYGGVLLDESARNRVVYWGYANRYFKDHMLFGGGYGMFEDITGAPQTAHNAYVLCYSELGLFGYWFWFNLMIVGLIGCWRTRVAFRYPKTPEQAYLKRVAGMSSAAMMGFAVSSFFLSRAYMFPLFFLFALLASVPVISQRYLPEGHPPLVNIKKDVLVTGTLCTIFSVAYIYISILLLNRI